MRGELKMQKLINGLLYSKYVLNMSVSLLKREYVVDITLYGRRHVLRRATNKTALRDKLR